ncbi:hypothetical protein BE17_31520 [Sorangium cellulosum]|uniref:Uncharacterized protein n=1 Tax=Sorangium cellulosum TaxID=56 RepID=A0A150RIM6_SORCE|nr:hypothetical protein BE17_31520 [Sorangium cellulosum]
MRHARSSHGPRPGEFLHAQPDTGPGAWICAHPRPTPSARSSLGAQTSTSSFASSSKSVTKVQLHS